jgi:hypothetical protein
MEGENLEDDFDEEISLNDNYSNIQSLDSSDDEEIRGKIYQM